jgi:hypothetical protein
MEGTPQATQAAQDGPGTPQGVQLPSDALESAQRAAEAQGKPATDWIANAIDAQAKREDMMGALSQAAAQAKENQWKIKERQKKESSDQ